MSRLIEIDEDIKLQPEEGGKEFGYFPFEELPPVTTQVIDEVIECEIGNINIQHTVFGTGNPCWSYQSQDVHPTKTMGVEMHIPPPKCNSFNDSRQLPLQTL